MTPLRKHLLQILVLLLLVSPRIASAEPAPAPTLPNVSQPSADAPYTGVWVDDSATLNDETLDQMVAGVTQQQADPQHIVIFIHGLATPRAVSAKQYQVLSKNAMAQFDKYGQRAAVVGLQWNSDMGPPKLWLKKVIEATLGLSNDNPYLRKVALARNVGATAGRQMFIKLHEKFPHAAIDVMAHSLGCDVTRNIFAYEIKEGSAKRVPGAPEPTAPFAPTIPIDFNLVAFAGADVDYDLLYKSDTPIQARGVARLFWLTTGGVRNPDDQDLVLTLRGFARGRALGNSIPHLHRGQIDMLCKTRRIVFDGSDIPENHAFLHYYDDKRLTRIIDASVALTDPGHHCKLLDTLQAVIDAPADPKVLVKFFDERQLAVTYYALWRLEIMLCGQPKHLQDGYLERIALLLHDDPKAIERERWIGPCLVVRQGYWPDSRTMYEAMQLHEPVPGTDPRSFEFP